MTLRKPSAFQRLRRRRQVFGRLLGGQPSEESKFHHLACPRIFDRKPWRASSKASRSAGGLISALHDRQLKLSSCPPRALAAALRRRSIDQNPPHRLGRCRKEMAPLIPSAEPSRHPPAGCKRHAPAPWLEESGPASP